MEDGGVKVLKERLEKFFHRVRPHFSGTYCDSALEIKHKKRKSGSNVTIKHREWKRCRVNTKYVVTQFVKYFLLFLTEWVL